MPYKEWVEYLPDGFSIVVRLTAKRGKITEFAVVLVYDEECISRYDTADGAPHKDVLGKKHGLIRKEWYENVSANKAFNNAIKDFKTNYRSQFNFFCTH
jgi:predicted glycosyl hydrolase (DUF1957 family)